MTAEEQKTYDEIMTEGRSVADAMKQYRHDQEVFAIARDLSLDAIPLTRRVKTQGHRGRNVCSYTDIGRSRATVCEPSRALLTLIAVVAGAAFLYTMPAFATLTPPTPPPAEIHMIDSTRGTVTYTPPTEQTAAEFGTALEYSARESISLLQARSMPAIDTTGVGTLLDFLLRLAGPVLLAFAVLALRAQTKR